MPDFLTGWNRRKPATVWTGANLCKLGMGCRTGILSEPAAQAAAIVLERAWGTVDTCINNQERKNRNISFTHTDDCGNSQPGKGRHREEAKTMSTIRLHRDPEVCSIKPVFIVDFK